MLTPSKVIPDGPAIALMAFPKITQKQKRMERSNTEQIRNAGHTFSRLRNK
jgi:hypothetical protein